MATRDTQEWLWRNLPLPETHLGVFAAGLSLTLIKGLRVTSGRWRARLGWLLIVEGIALAAWATRTAGTVDLEHPDRLVTGGPYARSRHPMYVAWTLIYVGMALALNSGWLLLLAPPLAWLVHRDTEREEHRLIEAFGSEYEAYRSRVRRYL